MSVKNQSIEVNYKKAPWSFEEVIRALRFVALPVDIPIKGFSIDSRSILPGEAFIALHGERFDGHDFVESAYEKGAVLTIVDRQDLACLEGKSYLMVNDTKEALLDLAQYARGRTSATVLAVSGSVGKTTTRTWCTQLLSICGPTVSSPHNFNNQIGLPLSLTQLGPDTKFGIFEIGIDVKDSMQPLATLCNPHVAILTPVRSAHIANFETSEALAFEKGQLFSGLACNGVAVIDHENYEVFPMLGHLAKEYGAAEIITIGFSDQATAYIQNIHMHGGLMEVHSHIAGVPVQYTLPMFGKHFAYNSLAALVGAISASHDLPLAEIMQTKWEDMQHAFLEIVRTFRPLDGRGAVYALSLSGKSITLIDDSYNANLDSMLAGMQSLSAQNSAQRRIAVVGDMLALGDQTKASHARLFQALQDDEAIDLVYAVGEFSKEPFSILSQEKRGTWAASVKDLIPQLLQDLQDGDVLWVKASHAIGLSEIRDALLQLDYSKEQNAKKIA